MQDFLWSLRHYMCLLNYPTWTFGAWINVTPWLLVWAYKAIDPGSNWDADREGVGLFLILNKQANLHYSHDIFPWGAKREKKPDRIWRALQHMASRRGVHASWVQLSRGALREGSGSDKTHTAAAAIVAVVWFCCWICLLLTLCSALMHAAHTNRDLRESLTVSDRHC